MAAIAILFLAVGLCNYEYETNSFETMRSSFIDIPKFFKGVFTSQRNSYQRWKTRV